MKIGLITPSFNQCKYIQLTIQSVLMQTRAIDYYAIYDSCSTDRTAGILNEYRDESRVSRIVVEKDSGQADAINKGFSAMPPDIEIMAYLNSDDLLLPDAIATVMEIFETRPDIDIVTGWRRNIGPRGRRGLLQKSHRRSRDAMLIDAGLNQETTFWRRSLYQKAGGYVDASFQFAMDYDLWMRMEHVGWSPLFLEKEIGCFRLHPSSKTNTVFSEIGLAEINRIRQRYGQMVLTLADFRSEVRALRIQEEGLIGFTYWRLLNQFQKRIGLPFIL